MSGESHLSSELELGRKATNPPALAGSECFT